MAQNPETAVISVAAADEATKDIINNDGADHTPAKKKRGSMNLIRVALYMVKRKKSKSVKADVISHGLWNRLLGSMRPLHLQSNRSPPLPLTIAAAKTPTAEQFEEVFPSPVSQHGGASPSSFSSVSREEAASQYASAVDLQELCKDEDCDTNEETIDAKAEEFIAQFYEQMRLQRLDSINRYYDEMNQRSIA